MNLTVENDLCPEAERACADHDNAPERLIEILHDINAECGHIPEAAIAVLAHCLNRSHAEILGVVSFYHDFDREAKPGKPVKICRGEACQAVGGAETFAAGEALAVTGELRVQEVFCLGNCARGPSIMIGDKLYGDVSPERLNSLLD